MASSRALSGALLAALLVAQVLLVKSASWHCSASLPHIHIAAFATDEAHLNATLLEVTGSVPGAEYDPRDYNSLRNGYQLWAELVNGNCNVSNGDGIRVGEVTYFVNLTEHFIGDCRDVLVPYAQRVVEEVALGMHGPADVFFGPFGSAMTNVVMPVLERLDRMLIAPTSTASTNYVCQAATLAAQPPCVADGQLRFRHLWGVSGQASWILKPSVQMLALRHDVRTIAFWAEDLPFLHEMIALAANVSAENHVAIVYNRTVERNPNETVVRGIVRQLKALQPDVVMSGSFNLAFQHFVRAMKALDYTPKALVMPLGIETPLAPDEDLDDREYIMGSVLWDKRLTGPLYADSRYFKCAQCHSTTDSAPSRFNAEFHARFGTDASVFAGLAVQAGYLLQEVIAATDSLNASVWEAALQRGRVQFTNFMGSVAFDSYHRNAGASYITLQQLHRNVEIIDPPSAATQTLVYPMPTWQQRHFYDSYLPRDEDWLRTLAAVLLCLLLVFIATLAAFLVLRRHTLVFVTVSPHFLWLVLAGSAIATLSYLSYVTVLHTLSCHVRIWGLNLGFSLVFGAIVSKTVLVARVYLNTSLRVYDFDARVTVLVLAPLLLLDVLLCALASWLAAPTLVKVTHSHVYEDANYLDCVARRGTVDSAVTLTQLLTKGALLLVCSIVTYKVRKVKHVLYFRENKWLAFSLYNAVLLGLVFVPLQFQELSRAARFLNAALFHVLLATSTLGFIFVPKLYYSFHETAAGMSRVSATHGGNSDFPTVRSVSRVTRAASTFTVRTTTASQPVAVPSEERGGPDRSADSDEDTVEVHAHSAHDTSLSDAAPTPERVFAEKLRRQRRTIRRLKRELSALKNEPRAQTDVPVLLTSRTVVESVSVSESVSESASPSESLSSSPSVSVSSSESASTSMSASLPGESVSESEDEGEERLPALPDPHTIRAHVGTPQRTRPDPRSFGRESTTLEFKL